MNAEELYAFFDALSEGRAKRLQAMLHEDVELTFPGSRFGGTFQGQRKIVVFLRQIQRFFRDGLRFTVVWAGLSGDRGIVQWTNAGTTREGTAYANRGCTVFRIEDGLIREIDDYLDTERMAETWPS